MNLLLLFIGLAIIGNFKRIFEKTNLDKPFTIYITKKLKLLAALFIISDMVKLIDYFIFNHWVSKYFEHEKFKMITTLGNDLIIGLIIFIISVIYQRGTELLEENALTV